VLLICYFLTHHSADRWDKQQQHNKDFADPES